MMAVVLAIFMIGVAVPSGLGRKCHASRHLRAGLSRFAPSGLFFWPDRITLSPRTAQMLSPGLHNLPEQRGRRLRIHFQFQRSRRRWYVAQR
jgi:hypothetical protein